MKKVVLIGDSIRMGYQPVVTELLAGDFEVVAPEANCTHSRVTREHLQEWVLDHQPDIVHYNNGLHDLARDRLRSSKIGGPRVPGNEYVENLRHNVQQMKAAGITVIFATTTPVNEVRHSQNKPFDRLEADVENYNRKASAVMKELDVPINDLYRVVMDAGRDQLLTNDGVHFTDEGSRILGDAVAKAIRAAG